MYFIIFRGFKLELSSLGICEFFTFELWNLSIFRITKSEFQGICKIFTLQTFAIRNFSDSSITCYERMSTYPLISVVRDNFLYKQQYPLFRAPNYDIKHLFPTIAPKWLRTCIITRHFAARRRSRSRTACVMILVTQTRYYAFLWSIIPALVGDIVGFRGAIISTRMP